ncbi:MAG: autotransporter-associated beta strand repeat-containing protein [Kiritimatiellae bacterium]|nr:autotransporter-associated beta strand repeat-containing protein [Kiritimatiellia bacterium]
MKKATMLLLGGVLAGACAQAYDWSQFTAGSVATIPEGVTADVSAADVATLNTFASVNLAATNSVLLFDLAEDATLTIAVTNQGQVVKRGAGRLKLESCNPAIPNYSNGKADYYTTAGFLIEEGEVTLPQNFPSTQSLALGPTTIGAAGVLCMPSAKNATLNCHLKVRALFGSGVITNRSNKTEHQLNVGFSADDCSAFAGKIMTPYTRYYSTGTVNLMGVDSDFSGDFAVYGGTTAGVKFGGDGSPSSFGTSKGVSLRSSTASGCTLRYLGTGEVSKRNINVWFRPAWIDGGAHGGLELAGSLSPNTVEQNDYRHNTTIYLTGSNTVPCVYSGSASEGPTVTGFDFRYSYRLAKRGTGTWILRDNAERKQTGVIAVEEGTLQYESVAETNVSCSLGLATHPLAETSTAYKEGDDVAHAIEFGSYNGATGTLENISSNWTCTTTRQIGLKADGRLSSASAKGAVAWTAGTYPIDAGTHTLYLVGTNANPNTLGNVSDGTVGGKLNLVKEGTGRWRLSGNQTFSGALAVRGGTLEVGNLRKYTWFRLVFKDTFSPSANIAGDEFALYGADGVRCNTNPTLVPDLSTLTGDSGDVYYDPATLEPGQVTFPANARITYYSGVRFLNRLFEDKATEMLFIVQGAKTMAPDKPATWQTAFVQRLAENAPEVVSYDWCSYYGTGQTLPTRILRAWRLEASADGVVWHTVDERSLTDDQVPVDAHVWYSTYENAESGGSETFARGAVRKLSDGKGYPISCRDSKPYSLLADASDVSVAPGATLKRIGDDPVTLSALTLDVAGGNGTIDGFDFAETGVVNLLGEAPSSAQVTAITFANLPDGALARLNAKGKWPVAVNGQPAPAFRVRFSETAATVLPPGTLVILR